MTDMKERSARLRKLGLVPTIQRLAVLEYLDNTDQHPTAEEIYAAIQKRLPTISRATVYNTLDILTKSHAIRRLTIDPTASRYDTLNDTHSHFYCRICHKVYDIESPRLRSVHNRIDGHRIETVQVYAYGICADCRKKQGEEEKDA